MSAETKPRSAAKTPAAQPLLTTVQAAAWLNVHPETLGKWHRENRGPACVLVHGRRRYRQSDLVAFVEPPETQRAA